LKYDNEIKHPTVPAAIRRKMRAEARIPLQRIAYSLRELEVSTSLSVDLLRAEIRKGSLRAFKSGTRVIVLAKDFESYLLARQACSVI
jgi:hypothetical protein